MNKALKYSLISLPILAGAYIVYTQVKKYNVPSKVPTPLKPSGLTTSGSMASTLPPAHTSIPESGCKFPLKKGNYNNTCVGLLQDALGITIDNDFGSNTQAALLEQTGIYQIDSNDQLEQIIDQLNNEYLADIQDTFQRSSQMINQLHAFGMSYKYIEFVASTSMKGVALTPGGWDLNGWQLNCDKGLRLNVNDYVMGDQPDSITGNLIIYCNKGGNTGNYMVSPTDIMLS